MDLSKLSDADLYALKAGDLSKVSDDGLSQLSGGAPKKPQPKTPTLLSEALGSIPAQFGFGAARGIGGIGATLTGQGDEGRKAVEKSLVGYGANPDSLAYGAGKLGSEIGATLPIGGALARLVGGGAGALPTALRTAGMSTGAAPLTMAGKAGDLALRTGAGAVVGGAGAGLISPSDMGTGAVVGGMLPGALQLTGAIAKPIGRAFSDKLASNEASRRIMAELSPDDLAKIQQGDIPLSAAGLTQNPAIARMEQASRIKSPEAWYGFDQTQGKAVFDKMMKATNEAADIQQRSISRSNNWKANWGDVEKAVKPDVFSSKIPKFVSNIDSALQSPESVNPAVRGMLETIKGEIARTGDNFSPAHLQQIRANLSGKYNPMSPNAFSSAPRDSKATRDVLSQVDDILNESTGGVWSKVPAAYKADSELLHQAKAASKVRGAFVDEATGRTLGTSLDPLGDIPRITETGLGRAMNAARMPATKNLALSPESLGDLESILQSLRKQNIVQGVKRTSTAGGGSDSVSNLASIATGGKSGLLRELLSMGKDAGARRTNNELAGLLSNPERLRAIQQAPIDDRILQQLIYRGAPALSAQ